MSDSGKIGNCYHCMMCGKLTENTFYCDPCMGKGEEAEEEELKCQMSKENADSK